MSEEAASAPNDILPITIAKDYLEGRGLTPGDPSEFEDEGISPDEDASAGFSAHNFHTGKIMVSVYEAEPSRVRIEGSLYDEFIQILEGRLILTPDSGGEFEFRKGDSLVLPKGYVGYWHMPEKYRELIIIDTAYLDDMQTADEAGEDP